MKSVFGAGDRRFYTLVHKVSSKYHKAGEAQQIIVDEIEIGRGAKCQVRFDESFSTVSRRHAAIVRDGDNWKLIQLSQTNSTYLNGHPVKKEWYLQNGDEIQLSTNGPKLGFVIPEGKKGTVGSLGLTTRLNLFRQQALRPYKRALWGVVCVLVICCGLGVYKICSQDKEIGRLMSQNVQISDDFRQRMAEADSLSEIKRYEDSVRYATEKADMEEKFKNEIAAERKKTDELIKEAQEKGIVAGGIDAIIQSQNILDDVYYIFTEKVVLVSKRDGEELVIPDSEGYDYGWAGTGFLLNDGRFVTARHCVEGWLFDYEPGEPITSVTYGVSTDNGRNYEIKAYLIAISTKSHTSFRFCSTDFKIDRSKDCRIQVGTDDYGDPVYGIFPWPRSSSWDPTMYANDWAYTTKTSGHKGTISADAQLSKTLHPMQKLYACGFPQGLGVEIEGIEPIISEMSVSRAGLAPNGCIMHSRGTDHGNSGGPVFALKDGKLVVVGIVSRGDLYSEEYNWAVPICYMY